MGGNVTVPPGETENVSESKMPLTVALPLPSSPAFTSLWYHDTPNGASGCWITNRSKPAPRGMPLIETFIVSLSRPVVIVARPLACGRQTLMAGEEGTSLNENVWAVLAGLPAPPVAPDAAVRPAVRAKPLTAPIASARRTNRAVILLACIELPSCESVSPVGRRN